MGPGCLICAKSNSGLQRITRFEPVLLTGGVQSDCLVRIVDKLWEIDEENVAAVATIQCDHAALGLFWFWKQNR
jgi:hypothetical protein